MGSRNMSGRAMMVSSFLLVFLSFSFHGRAANNKASSSRRAGSSVVFPLSGNVYPLGYYSVSLKIGRPSKTYDFDIDTGSDLSWVQCDAPCTGCTVPRDRQYRPNHNIVQCSDPLCAALHWPKNPQCKNPKDQCDYEIKYADQATSRGALVVDEYPLNLKNGSLFRPRLAFGCGYNQQFSGPHDPPPTAGVLGLGRGRVGMSTQLSSNGIAQNIVGHCLSHSGGGYLFFGDDPVPSSGVTWSPMPQNSDDKHYVTGPAEILYNGKSTGLKNLNFIFDSGSSYTYFSSKAYETIVSSIKSSLKGKPLRDETGDKTLPVCWKASKPLKSVRDVNKHFKTITLRFSRSAQFQVPPESYLIITRKGNVCLGILHGGEVGLGNDNVIGDIFMQGMMVVYDNERQQIGWMSDDCEPDRVNRGITSHQPKHSNPNVASASILIALSIIQLFRIT